VLDKNGHMLAMDRFNQIDYAFQLGRLEAMAKRYKPRVIMAEANAMGEPLVEQLKRRGMPVTGVQMTQVTKTQVIEALALAFEREEIKILPDRVLINELQAFGMERLPSGTMRYSAPSGLHDDCVIALALAWMGLSAPRPAIWWL